MTINDAHCHFFSEGFFGALARERAGSSTPDSVEAITGSLKWEAPGNLTTLADRWVAELNKHGVNRAALIAVSRALCCELRKSEKYILKFGRR